MNELIKTNSFLNLAGGGEAYTSSYGYRYKDLAKEDNGQHGLTNLALKSHYLTPSLITADDYYKINNLDNINLQLHASSVVSNPYTFNITKDIGFNAVCASKSTDIIITVGSKIFPGPNGMRSVFYGYNTVALTINSTPTPFGKCSPSTYKGVDIIGIILHFFYTNSIRNVDFSIVFAKHVNINKIIINNTIFNATTAIHSDKDDPQICKYSYGNLTINDGNLVNYFQNNDGKLITITLE